MANLGSENTPIEGESFGLPSGYSFDEEGGDLVIRDTDGTVAMRRADGAAWQLEGSDISAVGAFDSESVNTEDLNSTVWISESDDPQTLVDENGGNTTYYFESGQWNLESRIRYSGDDPIAFIGQGDSTIFNMDEDAEHAIITDTTGVLISSISIDQNGSGAGIRVQNGSRIYVENNTILNCGSHAIRVGGGGDSPAKDISISGNYIENVLSEKGINTYGPFASDEIHGCRIFNNTVINCEQEGIHPSADSKYNIIWGNYIEDCSTGIDSWNSEHNTIAMNSILDCGNGIDDASNDTGIVRCFGNYIENPDQYGIHYTTDGHAIYGNTIRDENNATAGIQLDANGMTVGHNTVQGGISGNIASNLLKANVGLDGKGILTGPSKKHIETINLSSDTEAVFDGLGDHDEYELRANLSLGGTSNAFVYLRFNNDGDGNENYIWWDEKGEKQPVDDQLPLFYDVGNFLRMSSVIEIEHSGGSRIGVNHRSRPARADRIDGFAREGGRIESDSLNSIELFGQTDDLSGEVHLYAIDYRT